MLAYKVNVTKCYCYLQGYPKLFILYTPESVIRSQHPWNFQQISLVQVGRFPYSSPKILTTAISESGPRWLFKMVSLLICIYPDS